MLTLKCEVYEVIGEGDRLSKYLKELFFEKANCYNNNDNKEGIEFLVECFSTLYGDADESIVLLDSKGMFLTSNNVNLMELVGCCFRYIEDISEEVQSITKENIFVHISKFNTIESCPTFHILTQPMYNTDIHTSFLGEYLQKVYLIANLYRNKYTELLMYLDSIQDGISAVDKDGILIYSNRACDNILDAKKEDIMGQKVDNLSKRRTILRDILETKQSKIDIEYFLEYGGKIIHLINSGFPVFDDKGNIQGAIDVFRSIDRSRNLANAIAGNNAVFEFNNIVGSSNEIISTIELAKKCALHSGNILIEGESGTGKELFAQSIHNFSNRNKGPFIAINCASLPNELVESELFGYEEGAFTGAKKGGKPGKFELANKGTLFLDEIGDMPIHIQAKFLRAVEYKTICRIGSSRVVNIDVRIIAATNKNLESMVKQGKFRSDLYYRLKVLYLKIPPLRERDEDIIELANYFMEQITRKMRKKIEYIDEEAREYLLSYKWPGNIRELENSIARAVFLCDDKIVKKEHLIKAGIIGGKISCKNVYDKSNTSPLDYTIVNEVYQSVSKNKKKTAELLGISRPTLYKLIKKYNID